MIASATTFVGSALGERFRAEMLKRPMVWGPHAVGGAEARPERL
jgi:hypothetical protein